MHRLSRDAILTDQMIMKYIENDTAERARKERLFNYYRGRHDILKRTMADPSRPNNRLVHPYPRYIVDAFTGYMFGEPVSYASNDQELMEAIKGVFNYNDESAENSALGKDAGVCGMAVELMYLDDDKQIRFQSVDPVGCIPVYSDALDEELMYLIRYYDTRDIITGQNHRYIEVYTPQAVRYFRDNAFQGEALHHWGMTPVVVYRNSPEMMGDFESVMSLIDAYDMLQSESLNEVNYLGDAYLMLQGMEGTEESDIAGMKEKRVLLVPQDAGAQWLIKSLDDNYVRGIKERVQADIHKLSGCPDMTDQNFASNASGVAIRYKLIQFDAVSAKKEREFKRGLQRRLELICSMLGVLGEDHDWRDVTISFTRNLPANLEEIAGSLNLLGSLISDETKRGLLPMDIDEEAEQERIARQKEAGYALFEPQQGAPYEQ